MDVKLAGSNTGRSIVDAADEVDNKTKMRGRVYKFSPFSGCRKIPMFLQFGGS